MRPTASQWCAAGRSRDGRARRGPVRRARRRRARPRGRRPGRAGRAPVRSASSPLQTRVVSSGAAKQAAPTAARPPQPESDPGRSRAHPRADSRMSRLVIAAELLGHARLETTRVYTRRPPRTAAKPSICCPLTSSGAQGRSAGPDAPFGLILAVNQPHRRRAETTRSDPREQRPDPHTTRTPQLHARTTTGARQRPRDRPPPAAQPRTARPHRCRGASPRAHPPAPRARP